MGSDAAYRDNTARSMNTLSIATPEARWRGNSNGVGVHSACSSTHIGRLPSTVHPTTEPPTSSSPAPSSSEYNYVVSMHRKASTEAQGSTHQA